MSRKAAVEPKWNFYLDTNKSTGIQYVQTSYNIWVPEKKQPRLGGKAYVGRLFPDGSVRPSKSFLERFPQYADTMQRWGSTDSWRINMLTRKQRECFALFGMTPMKGTSNN